MRKIFLVMLVAMFAAVSCQKSELTTQNGSGDEVTVNISAVMQSDNATTRAIDANGKASQINRCIMEIYTSDEELYQRQVTSVDASLKASFSINLVPDKTYDFVFWADYSTDGENDYYYTTTSLKEITANYSEYDGNDEKRDAFFATVNQTITASASNVEAKLYRPFGQVNVSTYVKDLIESYLPTTVQVEYTSNNIATTFNAFDGTTDGSTDFAWQEAATVIETVAVGETLYHLSTDYIFAPKEGQALIDFKMEFFNDGASIMVNDKFSSIPVQRNYRTNISGNLLTIGSDITVEVIPDFNESDIEVGVTTVETVEEVTNVLAVVQSGDDANVTVTGTVEGNDNHITVPTAVSGTTGETSITVTFDSVDATAEISFGGTTKADDSDYDGTVYITAPEGVEFTDLTINLPNAHIVFNGVAQYVDVASDELTFVVTEGSKIGTLTVKAGNVEILGTVDNIIFERDQDVITNVVVRTEEEFFKYFQQCNFVSGNYSYPEPSPVDYASRVQKVSLGANIDLNCGVLIDRESIIDGQGYELRTISDGTYMCSYNLYVENSLTLQNLDFTPGATHNWSKIYVSKENVNLTFENSTITDSEAYEDVIEISSSAHNCKVKLIDSHIYLTGSKSQSAILVGSTSSYTTFLTGCSVSLENSSIEYLVDGVLPTQTMVSDGIGIELGTSTAVEININNSKIAGMEYPLNMDEGQMDLDTFVNPTINISGSEITGLMSLFNGDGLTLNIENSTVRGLNSTNGTSNYEHTIKLFQTKNSTVNIESSTITAESFGSAPQYIMYVNGDGDSQNNVVNLKGTSNIVAEWNSTGSITYFIFDAGNGLDLVTINAEESVEFTSDILLANFSLWGSGTQDDPYEINTITEFYNIKYNLAEGVYYKQMCDIATSGSWSWTEAFCTKDNPFNGIYDGGGFAVGSHQRLAMGNTKCYDYVGLFGAIGESGVVKNVNMVESSDDAYLYLYSTFKLTTPQYIGSLAGYCAGTIENCTSDMTVDLTAAAISDDSCAGGLVGWLTETGSMTNCSYTGTATAYDNSELEWVGKCDGEIISAE